jgi:hypothetical protein
LPCLSPFAGLPDSVCGSVDGVFLFAPSFVARSHAKCRPKNFFTLPFQLPQKNFRANSLTQQEKKCSDRRLFCAGICGKKNTAKVCCGWCVVFATSYSRRQPQLLSGSAMKH